MQRIMRCALALVAGVSAASASLRIPTSNWTYDVLGPFPAGSREVADPLEAFGGITAIPRGDATRYPSELADGGNVTWTRVVSDANGKVTLYFPNFRDGFLGEALGLAVTSAQSWALADFHVEVAGQYFVQCLGAGEVYIDDTWFRGDSYGLSYWFGPNGLLLWPVRLTAGTHTLRVRTSTSFQCQFRNPPPGATSGSGLYVLDIATADARAYSPDLGVITPHVVDGWLAAPYVSVPVVNAGRGPLSSPSVTLVAVTPAANIALLHVNASGVAFPALPPGQAFPVTVALQQTAAVQCDAHGALTLTLRLAGTVDGAGALVDHNVSLPCTGFRAGAFRFTYLDADGTAQFAAVRAPVRNCADLPHRTCPVLLSTHGASVDAGSSTWVNAYQSQNYAWVLLPSGRGAYGFDWQGPARSNALAALAALAAAVPGAPVALRAAVTPDPTRLLLAGHSMGGHGCLVLSTHLADRTLGAACAAGWLRMSQYVSDYINQGTSFTDPVLRGLLAAAGSEYDTDVHAANLVGVPFLGRMGGADDNVSPWNLRRFARVLSQLSHSPGAATVSEIPGMGHWWGGIVDDAEMQAFFDAQLARAWPPPLPPSFSVVAASLRVGGAQGVRVLQTQSPPMLASLQVAARWDATGTELLLSVTSRNVRRFALTPAFFRRVNATRPAGASVTVSVDGAPALPAPQWPAAHLCLLPSLSDTRTRDVRVQRAGAGVLAAAAGASVWVRGAQWQVCRGSAWQLHERSESTAGPVRQVLDAPLAIVYGTQGPQRDACAAALPERCLTLRLALRLANDLFYQVRAGALVLPDEAVDQDVAARYNTLVIGGEHLNSWAARMLQHSTLAGRAVASNGSVGVGEARVAEAGAAALLFGALASSPALAADAPHRVRITASTTPAGSAATGAAALGDGARPPVRPITVFALLAGTDDAGLALATRLFPTRSAMPVPDYIIAGATAAWQGAGGYVTAGYWGNEFEVREDLAYPRPLSQVHSPALPAGPGGVGAWLTVLVSLLSGLVCFLAGYWLAFWRETSRRGGNARYRVVESPHA